MLDDVMVDGESMVDMMVDQWLIVNCTNINGC